MVIHQTCSRMKNTSLSTSFVPWIFFSALKKSQKEATALVHRCGKAKDFTAINCPGSSTGPSKLENDLMNQWRSLFLHMESVLTNENNELVSNSYCTLNQSFYFPSALLFCESRICVAWAASQLHSLGRHKGELQDQSRVDQQEAGGMKIEVIN